MLNFFALNLLGRVEAELVDDLSLGLSSSLDDMVEPIVCVCVCVCES